MNAVRRYSTNPMLRRWQERFDELQGRCRVDVYSPKIDELLEHGITQARWRCRKWGTCWHEGETLDLGIYSRRAKVDDLRWRYRCSACGTNRPQLILTAN